ncbi:hypothetical protein U1E44_14005 [Arenibacter sp. GZD96]|uniref:hypothetical protein n=1 Tax=Aurantibrevibacter litoralis TaxID=3106030 RepID=UPI002AFED830|nr:hypothetical protein [Arenibacter sp. GZD-96]MEA1787211.1 hypothetical protein [Arenibacter sp. GZD-96]
MKTVLLIVFLCTGTGLHAQTEQLFRNNDPNSLTPKFIVTRTKTTVYAKPNVKFVWNQVPLNYDNSDGRSRYKMTVTKSDNVANRTFDIRYTHYRITGATTGYIKTTINFKDSRPTKVFEDHFKKTN